MSAEHDLQQLRQALNRLVFEVAMKREAAQELIDDRGDAGVLSLNVDLAQSDCDLGLAALSRVGERIDAQQHKISELESLVAKSGNRTPDVRADAGPWASRAIVGRWLRLRSKHADESPVGLGMHLPDAGKLSAADQRSLFWQLANDAEHSWLLARLLQGDEPWPFEEWLMRSNYLPRASTVSVDRATEPEPRGPVSGAGGNT